jgi:hypothetical protein
LIRQSPQPFYKHGLPLSNSAALIAGIANVCVSHVPQRAKTLPTGFQDNLIAQRIIVFMNYCDITTRTS